MSLNAKEITEAGESTKSGTGYVGYLYETAE